MRYKQILEEGAKAYLPMYQGLPVLHQDLVEDFIDRAEKIFVRKDRVTWFCRWHRIWVVNHSQAELEARRDREAKEAGQPIPSEPLVSDKTWRKLLSSVSPSITHEHAVSEASDTLSAMKRFEHYLNLPIQAIKNVVWEKQMPDELLEQFDKLEEEWKQSLKDNRAVRIQPSDERIIDFKNGWGWWDLNRGGCRDEAEAMGHCGNGHGNYDETILSLRKQLDDTHLSPHLTFILHDGRTLGEMKGRNNEAPAAKYHGMIKALLLSKYVQDIKGGGYLPENNFKLADLPEADQEEIKTKKPQLRPAHEMWSEYRKNLENGIEIGSEQLDAIRKKVESEADKYGGAERFDWDKNEMIVDSRPLSSYTSFTNSMVSRLSELLEGEELIEIIEQFADQDSDKDNAERIAGAIEKKYYLPMVETILPYDIEFYLHEMQSRLTRDEKVEHFMDISGFLYTDDEELDSINALDDESDSFDDFDRFQNIDFRDAIEHAIFDYILASMKKNFGRGQERPDPDKHGLAQTILSEYGSQDRKNGTGGRYYTPTINDPRQMQFDFDKS